MAGSNKRFGVLAFGKQSAKGTPLAAPTYAVGKVSGSLKPTNDKEQLPLTGSSVQRWGPYKQRARGGGRVSIIADNASIGLLLYHVMGAQAVSGAGPYTHTFTMADDFPQANPLTFYDLVGDDWWRFADAFVSRLAIRGESGMNVILELEVIAMDTDRVAAPTFTLLDPEPRHKYIGSVVKLEADNATPATVDNVETFELEINRDPAIKYAAALEPKIIVPGRALDLSVGVTYDTAMQGWDFLSGSQLGAVAATGGLAQALGKGSAEITFGRHPVDAARFLRIATNGMNWVYDVERPESDPGGGPLEYDIAGELVRPTGGGTEATITLVNDVTAAY